MLFFFFFNKSTSPTYIEKFKTPRAKADCALQITEKQYYKSVINNTAALRNTVVSWPFKIFS
jgi:hypothetical protein